MILPQITELVGLCASHGITHVVISPGSRSAAISIAFEQHPDIEVKVVADERSAAFIAMGMAQQSQNTVVLVCTSGSASLNYSPAVAEAYYQEIPLLVITADRPPEWIDQYDGQTIQQVDIYGKHAKASFTLSVDFEHPDALWSANRQINQALLSCTSYPLGPVHINVPIREPFYPEKGEKYSFSAVRKIESISSHISLMDDQWEQLLNSWNESQKRMLVIGQHPRSTVLTRAIERLSAKSNITVVNEITGNQHGLKNKISHQDLFLAQDKLLEEPELLITIGNSLISKNLKRYLRQHQPKHQWHIRQGDRINDGLQSLTHMLEIEPSSFIESLTKKIDQSHSQESSDWTEINSRTAKKSNAFLSNAEFGELFAIAQCMKSVPSDSLLHLANSMAIRYANFIGVHDESIEVFCNRGTSGIDGSNGTAVGTALMTNQTVTLITGDMAFLYDRNAFWHEYELNNLRIIVLNNSGGGIFGMIPGPKKQKSFEKLFQTHQPLTAENTARDYGIDYTIAKTKSELEEALQTFFNSSETAKILEVFTDQKNNEEILKSYKNYCLGR